MWRDVALIRTISRFLRQIRVAYSQDYMWATLVKHGAIAAEIVRLFAHRFDPRPSEQDRKSAEAKGVDDIGRALAGVASLDDGSPELLGVAHGLGWFARAAARSTE